MGGSETSSLKPVVGECNHICNMYTQVQEAVHPLQLPSVCGGDEIHVLWWKSSWWVSIFRFVCIPVQVLNPTMTKCVGGEGARGGGGG